MAMDTQRTDTGPVEYFFYRMRFSRHLSLLVVGDVMGMKSRPEPASQDVGKAGSPAFGDVQGKKRLTGIVGSHVWELEVVDVPEAGGGFISLSHSR